MIIFIRKIPKSAKRQDLCAFVSEGLHARWLLPMFQRKSVEKCDILRIENMETQLSEYHGLVYVNSDKTGQALIKHLNGSRFCDREVEVRIYRKRSARQDRRRRLNGSNDLVIMDRRRRDRRRQNLIIETL